MVVKHPGEDRYICTFIPINKVKLKLLIFGDVYINRKIVSANYILEEILLKWALNTV